jgi:citrate synthase
MSWLTAPEALQVLGVRPQTLYANVSRKKIRAKPDPKDTRRSLYHEADVRKMARQHGGPRKATVVAAAAIEWGEPVLSSAVSTVVEGRLYYRGWDAVGLSEERAFEEVARILWGVDVGDGPLGGSQAAKGAGWLDGGRAVESAGPGAPGRGNVMAGDAARQRQQPLKIRREALSTPRGSQNASSSLPLQRAFLALGLRAATDLSSYGRASPTLQVEAESVLGTLADAMLDSSPMSRPRDRATPVRAGATPVRTRAAPARVEGSSALHDRAAANWRRPDAADILRRALVLLADHELNASTFATRVAVSTGAPLAAGVLSGLATLTGPLHGRASLGVLELVNGANRVGAEVTIRDWLSQGRPIAGFGHPLYPLGDPRATALLQQFPLPAEYAELRDVVEEAIGERPNVDFALAALTKVFNLPHEAPLILFALGRCAGWLAHALEQVTTGHPIRPRARYVGPPISSSV